MLNECWVFQSGMVPYEQAWEWQKKLAGQVARGALPPLLWLLEHPHTYTIGRQGTDAHLRWNREELARRQIPVYWVDRGGDITYHGPGQLVGYPILPLSQLGFTQPTPAEGTPKIDALAYVERLEQVLIRTLRNFGVTVVSRSGFRGVWIPVRGGDRSHQPGEWRKIASIGVKLTAQGVTQHGFALNIDSNSDYWEGIVPCGIHNCQMINLAELVQSLPDWDDILKRLIAEFGQVFQLRMVEVGELPFDTFLESHYTIPRGGC